MSAECDLCGSDLVGLQYDDKGLFCQLCEARQERNEAHRQLAAVIMAGEALSRSQDWILAGFPCKGDYDKADEAIKAWIKLQADIPAAAKEIGAKLERAEKLAEEEKGETGKTFLLS